MKWCIAVMKIMRSRTNSFQQGLLQTVDLGWVDGTIISIIKVRGTIDIDIDIIGDICVVTGQQWLLPIKQGYRLYAGTKGVASFKQEPLMHILFVGRD